MKGIVLALLAACLVACGGGDTPYTWGNVSSEVSVAYCDKFYACYAEQGGVATEAVVDSCARHNTWHLCEDDNSCGLVMPEGAEELVQACVDAMPSADCFFLTNFSVGPVECNPVFDLKPEE